MLSCIYLTSILNLPESIIINKVNKILIYICKSTSTPLMIPWRKKKTGLLHLSLSAASPRISLSLRVRKLPYLVNCSGPRELYDIYDCVLSCSAETGMITARTCRLKHPCSQPHQCHLHLQYQTWNKQSNQRSSFSILQKQVVAKLHHKNQAHHPSWSRHLFQNLSLKKKKIKSKAPISWPDWA